MNTILEPIEYKGKTVPRAHHFLTKEYGRFNILLTVILLMMSIAHPMLLFAVAAIPLSWLIRQALVQLVSMKSSNPWPLDDHEYPDEFYHPDPMVEEDTSREFIRDKILESKSEVTRQVRDRTPSNWAVTGMTESRFLQFSSVEMRTGIKPKPLDVLAASDKGRQALLAVREIEKAALTEDPVIPLNEISNVDGIAGGSVDNAALFGRKNSSKGRAGERRTATILNTIACRHPDEVYVLHDLITPNDPHKPNSHIEANIDHIIIVGNLVIPLDSKNYRTTGYSQASSVDNKSWSSMKREQVLNEAVSKTLSKETMSMIYDRVDKAVKRNVKERMTIHKTLSKTILPTTLSPWVIFNWSGTLNSFVDLGLLCWSDAYPITEGELMANIEYLCDGTHYNQAAVDALSPYLESRIR